ncbi:MAG: GntR family transcriptional regulator [Eubacterium sp.]|nr:GntR family transcriptional regulator [Eubacterium sp.]
MNIILSNESELPIYRQIFDQIQEQILSGAIPEGEVLPSIRKLAKELGISVITTTRAYNELESEGYIVSRQGKGSIVLGKNNSVVREQYQKRMEEAFEVMKVNAKYLEMSDEEILRYVEEHLEYECD